MTTRRALMAMTPLLGLATFPARAEAAEWGIATEYPATAMPGEGIAFFAETANLEAQGILHVRPAFDAPDGLRSARMPGAVAQGKPEAADAFTGALAGLAPILQLSALPFLTGSADDTRRLLEAARPAYVKVLSERGLTLLYATPWPATGLWSRRPVTGPESLTPSERRVADLAGEGKTNKEIAQILYVTPKTVEVHLSSTYRKLQIPGRAGLLAILGAVPEQGPPRKG